MSETIPPTDRLHHADTHLLNFEVHVLAVRRRAEGGWEVALDRSAFYVESG